MTPAVANLALAKGTAYDVALVIQDAAAQPIDLAGITLEASIRAASDAAPVDLAVIVTDAAAGLATVRIPPQPLGMGAWELWMQAAPETPRERALRGLVTVSETVDPREKENPSSHRLIVRVSDTVSVIVDAVDLAWWAYMRAVKAQLETESLAATWPQTVSNGEQAVNTAKNDALDALQDKQADAVLAVGRAQKTATDKIAGAQSTAVQAVQTAQTEAVGAVTPLVQRAETAKDDIDQAERRINTSADNAATSATSAANAATAAQQALEAMPQVDASGNMTLAGGLAAAGVVNANGGINIPLAVGAPTDTAAVNRFLAMGLAGAVQALIQPLYLKTSSMPVVGSGSTSVQYAGLYATSSTSAASGSPAHSTTTFTFEGPQGQHNYSSFAGFSIPLSGSTASKFTFGLGRGSKTVRGGLTMDSFSMIPGNNLAVNYGEIIDITTTAVRDSVRGGYVLRVREIYYVSSGDSWQVKTTESFIPATQNHPFPACLNRLIFMQEGLSSMSSYEGKASLYIELGGGQTNTLYKIAALRGVSGFEDGMGFSTLVADVENPNSWTSSVRTGAGNRYLYANGLINPMYAALEAMAVNAIESESTADFEDINIPL
nr:MAG TPA: hypothetical protein [Caudoviricetes sp.]